MTEIEINYHILALFYGHDEALRILDIVETDGEWSGLIPVDKPVLRIVKNS